MHYYEVAPRMIVRADQSTFTYAHTELLETGQLVEVAIGNKRAVGIITQRVKKPEYAVKPIDKLLALPPLPEQLLTTATWMSSYYATHLGTVLQSILPAGLTKNRRTRQSAPAKHRRDRTNFVFTPYQSTALNTLANTPTGTVILHGVTGSGKTAVYIEHAKSLLANGRSVIVLVPEIALTSQLVAEFEHHFSEVLLTHSEQTEAERHTVWQQALESQTPRIAIGPRSALFLPLYDIGAVIIDECHEPSFKQEQAPRYSALRVASVLAGKHEALVVLGSATPSVVDYYLAATHHRPIIELPKPARAQAVKPGVSLVDMTKRSGFTKHRFLSDALLQSIETSLQNGRQSLLFHNRRGSATTTLCEHCGWQAGCSRCYIPLTLHADHHQLVCHICGQASKVPTSCPQCHHADILHKGIGTKLIESEISKLFPEAKVARFDGDTSSGATLEKRYQDLYDGKIDIIIGTQVIAKGLDLPKLHTVGVVQADAGLAMPDYTSPERTFQLLAQVIGRVGRSEHPTEVVVQSYQPDHPAVRDGISQNYADFYQRTLKLRRATNFPPFCYLLKLTCIYKTEATAIKHARSLAETLRAQYPGDIEILGPTPAFYERVRDSYRWQIVVKSGRRQPLVDIAANLPPKYWQYELDPSSLL